MKKLIVAVTLICVLCGATTMTAEAFTMAEKVVVANELVLVARVPAGGLTAEQRINLMNDRLAPILGLEVLTPGNIQLARTRGEMALFVGDSLLTTITQADARANETTVEALAKVWLRNARRALPQARPQANIGILG